MKIVKGISLFFLYPLMMLVIGFYAGVEMTHYFYPGDGNAGMYQEQGYGKAPGDENPQAADAALRGGAYPDGQTGSGDQPGGMDIAAGSGQGIPDPGLPAGAVEDGLLTEETLLEAASGSDRLYVDTEYVLEETDIDDHTVVETAGKLPEKYIGMNREQFLAAMENYAAAPPLTEMERGFVGLEVLSFSRERVVVQMNYSYVKPSTSFYLAVYDNEVLVYLDDMETVYIETDIRLDSLPEEIQQEIIQMKWIENEEALFNFLESYSS